jgi:hypothetical protein
MAIEHPPYFFNGTNHVKGWNFHCHVGVRKGKGNSIEQLSEA